MLWPAIPYRYDTIDWELPGPAPGGNGQNSGNQNPDATAAPSQAAGRL